MKKGLRDASRGKFAAFSIAAGALLGLVGSSPAAAILITQTNASYIAATSTGVLSDQDGPNSDSAFSGALASSALSMESGTGGEAYAYADYGVLKANAVASALRGVTCPRI